MRCLRRQKLACGCPLRTSVRGIADSGRARRSCSAWLIATLAAVGGGVCVRRLETCRMFDTDHVFGSACGHSARLIWSWVGFQSSRSCAARAWSTDRARCPRIGREKPPPLTASGPRHSGWQDAQTLEVWAVRCRDRDRRCRMHERGASRLFRSVHRRGPIQGTLPSPDVSETTSAESGKLVDGRVFEHGLAWERSIARGGARWTCGQAGLHRCGRCCCQRRSSKPRPGPPG
jgi:hypothetical protein